MNISQKEEYKIIKNTSRQCTNNKNQRRNAQDLQMVKLPQEYALKVLRAKRELKVST